MSTSIRPPGGPAAPGATDIAALSDVQGTEAASPLDKSAGVGGAAGASGAAPTQGARAAESPSAALLSRLQAGEVTREQAIEGLVAQALEVHGGARLPPAQRTELQQVLRAALLDDPALGRLLGG